MAGNGMDSNQLTAPQQRAITALLSTKSVAEAAKKANVGQRTLFRWLADTAFKRQLAIAEGELVAVATRRLLQYQDSAITVITSIMADKTKPATVRLRASMAIVDYSLKMRELLNIEERLAALEELLAKQNN
jgi:hypothetical protein